MKEVLKVLASRISRKVILLAIAMILTYMLVVTPNAVHILIAMLVICSLALIGVALQYKLDNKESEKKEE